MEKVDLLGECVKEYQEQLKRGVIQKAYSGLVKYMMSLRSDFAKKHISEFTVGHLYQGYMDYTYFPIVTNNLKDKGLKVVVVLDHLKMQFEIYLVGQNKDITKEYLHLFLEKEWNKYHISQDREDTILDGVLVENPDFSDLDSLTIQVQEKTKDFINYAVSHLS